VRPTPRTEPLTFYRACLGEPDGTLMSPRGDHAWRLGLNHATCTRGHRPPAPGCGCGLWGLMTPEMSASYWTSEVSRGDGESPVIFLECKGFGRMEVGHDGCRVEAAQIDAILDVRQGTDLSSWAERYSVPIVISGLDLAVTVEGPLLEVNVPVDSPGHIGARIGDRIVNVPRFSALVFELWQVPFGTSVRVVRDLENSTHEVIAARTMP
jgi:hypothetical protein